VSLSPEHEPSKPAFLKSAEQRPVRLPYPNLIEKSSFVASRELFAGRADKPLDHETFRISFQQIGKHALQEKRRPSGVDLRQDR